MEEDENLAEEVYMEDAEVSFIEDTDEDSKADPSVGTIVGYIQKRFQKAENARNAEEQRWIKAYRNYRGLYGPDVSFTSSEKSRVFVKVTKTKVLAAYGQIVEVLFGANKFPITIDPTVLPEGVSEAVHLETEDTAKKMQEQQAPMGDAEQVQPGETLIDFRDRLAGLKEKLAPVQDNLEEGEAESPTQITFHPAMVAAKKMEKKIH